MFVQTPVQTFKAYLCTATEQIVQMHKLWFMSDVFSSDHQEFLKHQLCIQIYEMCIREDSFVLKIRSIMVRQTWYLNDSCSWRACYITSRSFVQVRNKTLTMTPLTRVGLHGAWHPSSFTGTERHRNILHQKNIWVRVETQNTTHISSYINDGDWLKIALASHEALRQSPKPLGLSSYYCHISG